MRSIQLCALISLLLLMSGVMSAAAFQSEQVSALKAKATQPASRAQDPAKPVANASAPPKALKGETNPTQDQPGNAGTGIKVTISSSTPVITLGSIYSMSASLENVSNTPIYVDLSSTQLAVHAILSPPMKSCAWFYDALHNSAFDDSAKSFLLQPQERVLVYFDLSERPTTNECNNGYWGELSKKINFSPGNYVFSVDGFYTPLGSTLPAPRTFSESATFQVGISQLRIVIFAAIGGILAYFLTSLKPDGDISMFVDQIFNTGKKTFSIDSLKLALALMIKILGAALLSGVFAIVSARSSDIKFPITITILDGWGAMTIGFLAYFAGGKIIQVLTGWYNKPSPDGAAGGQV